MNESSIQRFLRSEISFYITLIGAVLAIAGFYFGLSNKIGVIVERLDTHILNTSYIPLKIAQISEDVAVLKSEKK